MILAPRISAARVASSFLLLLTFSIVMPGSRHSFADSPRSPNDRQTTVTSQLRSEYKAIAPPARHTKSAEWALTTRAVRLLFIVLRIWPCANVFICALHRRRSVGMERFDRLESPRLSLLAFGFTPSNWLPVRGQNQTRAGV